MATRFFELVNDKFFSPFTSVNKNLNYDLLYLINSKMNNEMKQFPRDEVIAWLVDYLKDCPISIIDDETGKSDISDQVYRQLKRKEMKKGLPSKKSNPK